MTMPLQCPTLIVFGGLPGTGKTTVSRALSAQFGVTYLRIDAIEQAIRTAGILEFGPAGYAVANAVAVSNLKNGISVVADCVNPVAASRRGWRETAISASAGLVEIQLICSDPIEHRRRVETRSADIPGHQTPSWSSVIQCAFEPWEGDHLILDAAKSSPGELIDLAKAYVIERSTIGA